MKSLIVDQILSVNYKYTVNLINNLYKYDVNIQLVSDEKKDFKEVNCGVEMKFNTTDKSLSKIKKAINYIKTWRYIVKKCEKEDIDLIHVQWFILSPIDWLYLKKLNSKGVKIVVTVHDILPFNQKFYDYKYHKKIYELANKIIVQAQINKEKIIKLFDGLDNKVVYIPHGNFVNYAKQINKKEARDYLNLPQDKKIILFFGQIKKVKGLDYLLNAMVKINKIRDDIILVIAGKVWEDKFDKYRKIIDDNKLTNVVRCDIKYIPDNDISYYYSACDLNALPYLNVYQSGVIQLAYAHRKPVVASDIPSFREVVLDNISGKLFETKNSEELSSSILELFNGQYDLSEMGQKGYDYIEDKFSWDKIAKSVAAIYEEVGGKI
ncbi:glycosyltransferase family 4 protein [Clostridium intestinale]|uniref:glycosyltransferase family 4 protein n=1 Tax=Clostridium intestinale TaxID=36845 RepID=UPI002DD64C07|nr:glycosyltransferase family 4 protein [Clostridium intestinale]WRY49811.1 glycosyltransferase family 4 protein [Clostridium intestinale]